MSNVIGLHGHEIPAPGEANPQVVELAEQLLEQARSGEIKGLYAFMTHADDCVSSRGRGPMSLRLIGALTEAIHEICKGRE